MDKTIQKRKATGFVDYVALALTTFGVGYIPGAPGTYGSVVGLALYVLFGMILQLQRVSLTERPVRVPFELMDAWSAVLVLIFVLALILAGIWASSRTAPIFGRDDPHEAVVDEVMGQIVTFLFIPFTTDWKLILAGFVFFRLFDIWKPYPIDDLQALPKGLGICADDLVAGVYAGICLSVVYAIILM